MSNNKHVRNLPSAIYIIELFVVWNINLKPFYDIKSMEVCIAAGKNLGIIQLAWLKSCVSQTLLFFIPSSDKENSQVWEEQRVLSNIWEK